MMPTMITVVVAEAPVIDDPADLGLLDETERSRAARKRHPAPFVSAHALVRRTLGARLDTDPASLSFVRRCPTCGSTRHGKPALAVPDQDPPVRFSLSYTDHLAVVAVAERVEVGVDVEHVLEADFADFDRVTLAPEEVGALAAYDGAELLAARAQVSSRKEAILKATGHGLVVDPTEVVVTPPDVPAELVGWRAAEAGPTRLSVQDARLRAEDHRATVAVLADGGLRVEHLAG